MATRRTATQEWQDPFDWTKTPEYEELNAWVYRNFIYSDGPRMTTWGINKYNQRTWEYIETRSQIEPGEEDVITIDPHAPAEYIYLAERLSTSDQATLLRNILRWRNGANFERLSHRRWGAFKAGIQHAPVFFAWADVPTKEGESWKIIKNPTWDLALNLLQEQLTQEGYL